MEKIININYLNILLSLLDKDYVLNNLSISLNDYEETLLGILDSFVNGVIMSVEDIKNEDTKKFLEDFNIDNNILIDLRKKFNELDNIYQEIDIYSNIPYTQLTYIKK